MYSLKKRLLEYLRLESLFYYDLLNPLLDLKNTLC